MDAQRPVLWPWIRSAEVMVNVVMRMGTQQQQKDAQETKNYTCTQTYTVLCLSIGTSKNNKFSICSKWKIYYF